MPSNSGCGRCALSVFQPICGIFRVGSDGAIRSTSPGIQPSPGITSYSRPRSAMSCMPTQIPRNGRARTAHAVVERLDHAADGVEPAPAIGEGADAGQHHAIGAPDLLRIGRHHDRLVQSFLARGALERLRRRVQIARAVIDDRHAHRGAPGCGNRPRTSDEPCGWRASRRCERRARCAAAGSGCVGRGWIGPRLVDPCVEKPPLGRFEIVTDDDADVLPAPARQRETTQRGGLETDEQRQQQADRDDHP